MIIPRWIYGPIWALSLGFFIGAITIFTTDGDRLHHLIFAVSGFIAVILMPLVFRPKE